MTIIGDLKLFSFFVRGGAFANDDNFLITMELEFKILDIADVAATIVIVVGDWRYPGG